MYLGARIAVVVPAHNESALIGRMLRGIPDFVDSVVVVDDASDDDTRDQVLACGVARVRLVEHAINRGVGAAIVTGYRAARDRGADVVAVMAGDDQMDPLDLESVIRPVVEGKADYAKGDRLHHPEVGTMPWTRRLGSAVLTWMTRRACDLPTLSDSQCGYTAISAEAIDTIDWTSLWPRFGYPNDLIAHVVSHRMTTTEVIVRPVYKGERSELRAWHVVSIMRVVARAAVRVQRNR
jgi:glycosyltransferase involved in cell wall biosynthesis